MQRIALLSAYIEKLLHPPPSATPSRLDAELHGNWTESDWDSFDNRYYVHAPKLSLSNGTRNVSFESIMEAWLISGRFFCNTTTSLDDAEGLNIIWLQGESSPQLCDHGAYNRSL